MKTSPSASSRVALLCAALFAISATASAGESITGKITDAQTGNPLPSMVVSAYGTILQASATSDANGRYSLSVPGGASYRVLAYDNAGVYATMFYGDADSFEAITPIPADSSNINFALRRAGTISGSITTSTGAVNGITVAAYNLSGSRRGFTSTNSSGAYNLVLPPGGYKIAAYDDAGTFWPKFFPNVNTFDAATAISVTAGQSSVTSLALDAAANIVGSVVDTSTHLPISAMTVEAYDPSGVRLSQTSTDTGGSFHLRVPPGTFRVVASDPQQTYATSYYGGVAFTTATDITLAAGATQSSVQIEMPRAGTINGQTMDTAGTPLNVTVAAYGLDGSLRGSVPSTNGTFRLSLAPGDYRIAAYDNNLVYATQFYSRQDTFSAATPVTVTSGVAPGSLLLFVLSRGARISGTILDSQTAAAVPGITVGAYDANNETLSNATTGAAGNYALVVPAGTYRFVAFDASRHYAAAFAGGASYETGAAYALPSGSIEQINFSITRGIRVTGVVKDTAGAGVSGVEVSALDPSGNHAGSAISNDGAFDLALLPNQYRFVATDPQLRFGTAYALSTVTITWDDPAKTITITVVSRQRRRSVPH